MHLTEAAGELERGMIGRVERQHLLEGPAGPRLVTRFIQTSRQGVMPFDLSLFNFGEGLKDGQRFSVEKFPLVVRVAQELKSSGIAMGAVVFPECLSRVPGNRMPGEHHREKTLPPGFPGGVSDAGIVELFDRLGIRGLSCDDEVDSEILPLDGGLGIALCRRFDKLFGF